MHGHTYIKVCKFVSKLCLLTGIFYLTLQNCMLVVTENFIDIMTLTEAEMFHIKFKKLTVSQPVKKVPAFFGTLRFTTARPDNFSLP